MWTDLKEGATDITMAGHETSPGPCTALERTPLRYFPHHNTSLTSRKVHRSPRGLSPLSCEQVVNIRGLTTPEEKEGVG